MKTNDRLKNWILNNPEAESRINWNILREQAAKNSLREKLREIKKKNREVRDSFKLTDEVLSFRCY